MAASRGRGGALSRAVRGQSHAAMQRICLHRQCCYPRNVSERETPQSRSGRLITATLVLALAAGISGCATTDANSAPASSVSLVTTPPALPGEDARWWLGSGDAMLVHLIETGFANNRDLACAALVLRNADSKAESRSRRIDSRITRLFDTRGATADEAERDARGFRYASMRANLARTIADAYLDVREAQEILSMRQRLRAQFKDNAEIAAFRAEAGLVPGLDASLAGSLIALNDDEFAAARTHLADRIAKLAALVGEPAEALTQQLGQTGAVPDIAAMPSDDEATTGIAGRADLRALERRLSAHLMREKVSQDEVSTDLTDSADAASPAGAVLRQWEQAMDRSQTELARNNQAVVTAAKRQSDIEAAIGGADDAVSAARLGYRNGTGNLATLYVAEAAHLGLAESRVSARADLARATIAMWTAQGRGWAVEDLAPPPPAQDEAALNGEVLVCD